MRVKLRRALVLGIGVTLLASACGSDDGESASETSAPEATEAAGEEGAPTRSDADLVIWADATKGPVLEPIADAFGEDNGITVDVQVVSSNLQSNFVTADAAGNGPDVVVGAHDWIGNLVQNGSIAPLQLSADQLSAYNPKAVESVTYNGQVYGLPYGVEGLALYRNTDVAPDEVASLDEAISIGQAAVDEGTVEVAISLPVGDNGDAYHMHPIYTSMGGYLFGTDAEGGYDPTDLGVGQQGSLDAAQKIYDLGEAGEGVLSRSVSVDNNIALFTDGNAAFLVSGPWALNDVQASGVPYAVQAFPGFDGQDPAAPFMGAQSFMVAANGANQAFAQEFATNGMNNEEAMTELFEATKLPPSMTSVAEAIAADNPDIAVFAEAAEAFQPMPAIPAMSAVWEPLGQAYAAIVGGADPTETMTQTGDTINAAIGN